MLRDCNTLVSNISVQLLNRDTGKMVRSALRTAAVALQSRCYFKVAGNTKQSVLRLVHSEKEKKSCFMLSALTTFCEAF